MKVIFLIGKGQAYTYAERIAKEFKKSIRFDIGNSETITIKKKDILSIEKEEEKPLYRVREEHLRKLKNGYPFIEHSHYWKEGKIPC